MYRLACKDKKIEGYPAWTFTTPMKITEATAPIICTKGMFNISGQMNDNSGGFTTINGIAGEFSAKSPGSTFTVDLKQATQQEYTDAQKLING